MNEGEALSPGRRRLRRIRAILSLAALGLSVGLGALVLRSLEDARAEQRLRGEALAMRIVGELDTSLGRFVAEEQARPFVQWREEWVPRQGEAAVASPLAAAPERDFVLGYFQIEPDGSFASPMADASRVAMLRPLSADLEPGGGRFGGAEGPMLAAANEPVQVQQRANEALADLEIQQAIEQQAQNRRNDVVQKQQAKFDPDIAQLGNFLNGDALGNKGGVGFGAELEPPRDDLDVRTTTFAVEAPSAEHLRLLRTVTIGEQVWVQGVVVDRRALEAWLESELLGEAEAELGSRLSLDWSPEGPSDAALGRWVHALSPPFSGLPVAVELGPARALADPGARVNLALALALLLATFAGLVAIERTLATLILEAEARERFVAAVTHELRTPLTSIRMYSEMLEQGMVADPERRRSYHGTIRREAERLSRLVEAVLTLSRIERAKGGGGAGAGLGAGAEVAELGGLIDELRERMAPQIEAAGVELRAELEPALADLALPRDALAQILTNLVDNALEHGAGEVELSARREGGGLTLRVADRGPGVDPATLPRIFQAFVRAEAAHAEARKGTGIGLAVVRGLVDELGGRVWARNREGGGLEVHVALPLR